MNNLSKSDIKNIKEKLVNNDNKTKKDPNECKSIKYIRYLFNEDKNKRTNLYKAEKMKNLAVKNIKDLNECNVLKISDICLMVIYTKVLLTLDICLMKIIMYKLLKVNLKNFLII